MSFATVSSAADDITTGDAAVTIGTSSGTITLDAASTVKLDAGNAEIHLLGSGTTFGKLFVSSSDFYINNPTQDEDIIFSGNDNGSAVTALTLDMSEAGAATFNSSVGIGVAPGSLLHLKSGNRELKFILADSPSTGNVGAQIRGGSGEFIGIAADGTGIGLVVDDSNNVGIGVISPSSKLHLESGSAHNKLSITSTATVSYTHLRAHETDS